MSRSGDKKQKMKTGEIRCDGKKYIDVACADGLLRIKTLQLAGKKRLNADELLRGFTIDERFRFI